MTDIQLPYVLGLAGRKGAGKTYLAKRLEERGWVRLAFADPVKELALTLDPIIAETDVERYRLSDIVQDGWDIAKQSPEVRRILQVVGTEIGRAIDPDVWVNKMADRIYKLPAGTKVVIDDVRFPNEADKIRHAWGGTVIRLEGGEQGDLHESERLVDSLDVSFSLDAGTVRSLDYDKLTLLLPTS